MAEANPIFLIEAEALANIIDELDYFQIMKVDRKAKPDQLKAAYFRESRLYHPDQFFRMEDGPAKQAIAKIYKRVNEAWVVLSDDTKRGKYLADVAGPDRAKKLRYTDSSEEELKRQREAEMGTTPQGRKTFQQGLLDLEAGRYQQAVMNFKMATQFEPANIFFREKLNEAVRLAGPQEVTLFDLTLAALVLVGALWGMLRGAIRQVASVLAWTGSIVVPWKLAGPVAHLLEGPLAVPFPVVYALTVFALALLTQIVVRLVFGVGRAAWLKRRASTPQAKEEEDPSELRQAFDRSAGTFIGASLMAMLLWFGASILTLADAPLEREGLNFHMETSEVMRIAGTYNAVALLFGPEIHRLDRALQRMEERARTPAVHHGALETVEADLRWQSITHDNALSRALLTGDLHALKRSPVLSLLTDHRALDLASQAADSTPSGTP